MASKSARAARCGHSGDPLIEQLRRQLDPIHSPTPTAIQARWLEHRFRLSPIQAAIIAEHAFAARGR